LTYRITRWTEMGRPVWLIEQKGIFWGWKRLQWCDTEDDAMQWLDELQGALQKKNVVHIRTFDINGESV
jgi:hypothetical protein